MRYLHAMVRVRDLDASLKFFRDSLGLVETRRRDYPESRFTLVYLGAPKNPEAEVELTFNYDDEGYGSARNFGHLAFEVDDIHATCAHLQAQAVPTAQLVPCVTPLPVGWSLNRRAWLMTAAPTKWLLGVYCGHASRQQPQLMHRLRG